MIHLMVLLRAPDGIKACHLFTKHYEPMTMDFAGRQAEVWLYLYLYHGLPDFWRLEQQASSVNAPLLCSSGCKSSLCRSYLVPSPHRRFRDIVFLKDFLSFRNLENVVSQAQLHDHVSDVNSVNASTTTKSNAAICDSGASRPVESICVAMVPEKFCTVFLNGHVANALLTCMVSSPVFRWCLLRNLRKKFQRAMSYHTGSRESDVDVVVHYILDIVSVWPVQRIDYLWGWYMNHILTKRMLLEEAMALLSTLGGAHSSLGEYFLHHAERAGEISIKQLKLALELGDPLTVARCHMFWAFSLMQRGHWRKAKVLVRQVYRLASTHCVVDNRLINMCQSAWNRIQHLHRVHRRNQKTLLHRHNGGAVEAGEAGELSSTRSHSV